MDILSDGFESVIQRGGNYYWVSTKNTFDHGWETMVFLSDENGTVLDWSELFCARYSVISEAGIGHNSVVQNFQPASLRQHVN